MARKRSGTGRWQRSLLFAALLFGIVGMHTLGHPSGHDAGHGESMSAPVSTMTAAAHDTAHAAITVHEHHPDSPGHGGMDPLNVCLAVLASFTLLLLTAAVLRPLLVAVAPGPRARGLTLAQRPNPPPPRTLLSQLSVLRI